MLYIYNLSQGVRDPQLKLFLNYSSHEEIILILILISQIISYME